MQKGLTLFGKQLRILRLERDLSQEKLAELCKVHRNFIGRIERAERNIKFDNVMRLAMGLKVRPDELFKLIPKPLPSEIPDAPEKKKNKKTIR